jgi:predicted short-subunit dehydrogenase-like oxidoreductase (DUF2520 family)
MLPGMKRRSLDGPAISIVGAGHLATALAVALHSAGYRVLEIISRAERSSRKRASTLAQRVGGIVVDVGTGHVRGDIVWLCVPDREIPRCARGLARGDWKGKIALHSSGALASDELRSLQKRGAQVASVHPLMTFVAGSHASFTGMPFAVEGDVRAVRTAKQIIVGLGARAYPIHQRDKAAYHAWGTFASPMLTALLATTEQVARRAGVSTQEARRRMMPILRQTLANYASFGAANAFSGPIVRGDVDTVKRHLRALASTPVARAVYAALAQAAIAYLPAKNKAGLRHVIDRALRK